MSTLTHLHSDEPIDTLHLPQDLSYNWQYDAHRERLVHLYESAKRDQWNGSDYLDWSTDVDPRRGLLPDPGLGIYGTPMWKKLTPGEIERLRHESITWQLCQFLHGEQGALLVTAQIVDSVPWYEAKQYGATQVMDEARHVEVYRRYILEKLEHEYPISPTLKQLLDQILSDSRWDMKFLGMHIIVEGLALAAFGTIRDATTDPLLRALVAGVMEDELRHISFGLFSLREHCRNLNERERAEREDFVFEACLLLRDRLSNREVWETMGMDVEACVEAAERSRIAQQFRFRLFSKVVPNMKSLGLLSERQRERFDKLGILHFENGWPSDLDLEADEQLRRRNSRIASPRSF
jgi:hypothetical protein